MVSLRRICFVVSGRYDWTRAQSVVEALVDRGDVQPMVLTCGLFGSQCDTPTDVLVNHLSTMSNLGSDPSMMAKSYADLCWLLTTAFYERKPDVVVAMTDRYEALATASVAALMNITVAHIQGGEVTGTIDESCRHACTKLAHWHFPATEQSRDRIIRLGEPPERVWNFGCPATDLLLRENVELNVDMGILALMHPVTTEWKDTYKSTKAVFEAIQAAGKDHGWGPAGGYWVGPNHDAGANAINQALKDSGITPNASMRHSTFIEWMAQATVLVGNSSAGIREAGYFGTPVVNVGSRQSGRERGSNVLDVEPVAESIIEAVKAQLAHGRYPVEQIYGDGTAGPRIAEVLATEPLPSSQKKITY